MQTIELDLDQPNFFCPVTGRQILSEESCMPSPATIYVYIDEANVFDFVREDLKPLAEEIEAMDALDDRESDDAGKGDGSPDLYSAFDEMKAALPDPSVVDFVLSCTEMACGPADTRIRIGIDMNGTGKAAGTAD